MRVLIRPVMATQGLSLCLTPDGNIPQVEVVNSSRDIQTVETYLDSWLETTFGFDNLFFVKHLVSILLIHGDLHIIYGCWIDQPVKDKEARMEWRAIYEFITDENIPEHERGIAKKAGEKIWQ